VVKFISMTAALTTLTIVGWPAAVIGTSLVISLTLTLVWVLRSQERTCRLVKVIDAIRANRRPPQSNQEGAVPVCDRQAS
jgi:hypothetical protein